MDVSRVQRLYGDLQRSIVNANSYQGEIQELVFELIDAETFVAGIASTLLEGRRPDAPSVSILKETFLVGTQWVRSDGSHFDLQRSPELLEHARHVEALKDACASLVLSTH